MKYDVYSNGKGYNVFFVDQETGGIVYRIDQSAHVEIMYMGIKSNIKDKQFTDWRKVCSLSDLSQAIQYKVDEEKKR